MSFWVSLRDAPEEAEHWMPIFYYRDPETGIYTPYYPENYLDIPQSWLCPLSAGAGIMVDFRCVVYDSNYEIIGTRDLSNIVVKDSEDFIYSWKKEGVSPWAIVAPIGIVAVIGIALAAKKGGRG